MFWARNIYQSEFSYIKPIMATWLHQNTHNWLIWWFTDLKMIPMRPLDFGVNIWGSLGDILGENVEIKGENGQFLPKNQVFKQILITLSVFFSKFSLRNPQILNYPFKWACSRSCKRSKTLFKSLLFWLAGELSWLAVKVLFPCQK